MELSVIIVSYNVRHFLEQCLASVRKAGTGIMLEIFVVDNNSADGSCAMISHKFPEAKLIINHVNRGFSTANNQALKIATGKYILLLNPDTLVEEETFKKCISFMESHPDAGAIGVRMINGKGRLLPESKRGLPTPKTAFFKIAGLSRIFPRSGTLNSYYLGNLDSMQTAESPVISGAFMFIRGEAVSKTGYLDEDYFMYGEDIDYSYRLLKAGFRNYYFPETRIIHFKGESTKKEDLNVFISFYRAMLIFVKKHLNNGNSKIFISIIKAAILFRAGLTLIKRAARAIALPLFEGIIIYLIFRLVESTWETFKFGTDYNYPEIFSGINILIYTLIILFSTIIYAGYKIPVNPGTSMKCIMTGILIILIIYALLPLNLRFSRAVIIFGGLILLIAVPMWRVLISLFLPDLADNPFKKIGNTVIISGPEGYARVKDLMSSLGMKNRIIGRVSIDQEDLKEEVLGSIDQLKEVIRINRIKEVIFTTSELTAAQIIDNMYLISKTNIRIRIAADKEKYIFGSRYVSHLDGFIPSGRHSFAAKSTGILKKIFR